MDIPGFIEKIARVNAEVETGEVTLKIRRSDAWKLAVAMADARLDKVDSLATAYHVLLSVGLSEEMRAKAHDYALSQLGYTGE